MSVPYVEREDADEQTRKFYDAATERFEMLLNIFKVFGHTLALGAGPCSRTETSIGRPRS